MNARPSGPGRFFPWVTASRPLMRTIAPGFALAGPIGLALVVATLPGCSPGDRVSDGKSGWNHFEGDTRTFTARAAEALRDRGLKVAWSSDRQVQSRPRPVPSLLEPWAAGPGEGAPLAAVATLGEVRQVATLRRSPSGEVLAEVWLERARRPDRRLVMRADGGVFSSLDTADALVGSGGAAPAGGPFGEGLTDATPGEGVEEPPGPLPIDPSEAAASTPESGGLRWHRWRRSPAAEAELLSAWRHAAG